MNGITYNLGNLADWLSALGTVAAVSLALWLVALREGKDRLGFTVSAESQKLVVIVFNAGARPVVVTSKWNLAGSIRTGSNQSNPFSLVDLPMVLRVGEDARLEHELSSYKSYLPDRLFEAAQKKFPWNRQIYFAVTTGTGRRVRHMLTNFDRERLVRKGD